MNYRARNLVIWAICASVLVVAWFILRAHAADENGAGLWRETGYMEDETGKRTECTGGSCPSIFPGLAKFDTLCASGQDLKAYAREHLADFANLFRSRMHNCKDIEGGVVNCDEGSATKTISLSDATTVEFSFITQGMGHRMTRLWRYEWIGNDCSGAKSVLRRRTPSEIPPN